MISCAPRSRASCAWKRASTCAAASTPPWSPSTARKAGAARCHNDAAFVNPLLAKLQPYPFEKLRALIAGNTPPAELRPINLQIGEPKHPTPALVKDALAGALDGLASYPLTAGTLELREAISPWLARRYGIPAPDPATEVLPVNGSREALFAFAQTVIDPPRGARVVCPNPFYQIYEGAALLGGATPIYGEPESWA